MVAGDSHWAVTLVVPQYKYCYRGVLALTVMPNLTVLVKRRRFQTF